MADQDFKISIITTADTKGITQTEDQLKRLEAFKQQMNAREAARLESERAKAQGEKPPPIPPEYRGLDPTSALNRAGAAVAAIESYILREFVKAEEELTKLNREVLEQTERVNKLTTSWREEASAATSSDQIAGIVKKASIEIDALNQKIQGSGKALLSFSQGGIQGLSGFLNTISGITTGIKPFDAEQFSKGIYQATEQLKRLRQNEIDAAADAIQMGRDLDQAILSDKFGNTADLIAQVTRSISEAKDQMRQLDVHTADGLRLWQQYNQLAKQGEQRLQALNKLPPTTQFSELQKQYQELDRLSNLPLSDEDKRKLREQEDALQRKMRDVFESDAKIAISRDAGATGHVSNVLPERRAGESLEEYNQDILSALRQLLDLWR